MNIKISVLATILYFAGNAAIAQQKLNVLQVPGINQFCTIKEKGVSVIPSGRYLTPAGSLIRITNDPFGMGDGVTAGRRGESRTRTCDDRA